MQMEHNTFNLLEIWINEPNPFPIIPKIKKVETRPPGAAILWYMVIVLSFLKKSMCKEKCLIKYAD